MPKTHKPSDSRPIQPQHIASPRCVPPHRRSAELRLRIMEKLVAGLSVARIAQFEKLTVRRVRQIVAETLAKRETDPPAGYVQLQIARLNEAMMVAHSMTMNGDLGAMDRLIRLTSELDRYHGFSREPVAPAASQEPAPRLSPPERRLSLPNATAMEVGAEILPAARD